MPGDVEATDAAGQSRQGTHQVVGARKGPILAALCLAALIINIDVTIVNVALPSLVRELGATTTSLQWVVDAYTLVFAALILAAGGGLGLITAPATEAIMGAVPTAKAGVGSAVNDATRLFGAALGVAVTGSVAASLYSSRLDQTIPRRLPAEAVNAADGSVGGALVAAQNLQHAGLAGPAHQLSAAASDAFIHGLHGTYPILGAVALVGALIAAALLPSRPAAPTVTQAPPATPLGPCIEVPLVGGAPVASARPPDGRNR
jgi:MFS family permease